LMDECGLLGYAKDSGEEATFVVKTLSKKEKPAGKTTGRSIGRNSF